MEIRLSPLGEYLIFINNPKHQALRFWVCELLYQSTCLCCASAPVLRVAKRRYHEPLGRYAMPRFTVIIIENGRALFCPRSPLRNPHDRTALPITSAGRFSLRTSERSRLKAANAAALKKYLKPGVIRDLD